ncbi:outer membrane efflux protein [Emticicia oligotrophica DSM 17448]|uniref:Outer membrane efflux protein n=1 Tax=Emticicia oligotrophica (strain DSM 17448 / CIP 109782 / MTCC 6937 / GPTSA100-15) TaxID=929562 RepID=A0ABN4AP12_EMTOG|nr:TolC family protein [Emticicia oligotrophica]AFK03984.1 outer membrane efflux protein [Emticicia oligotrophica DSM 17448]
MKKIFFLIFLLPAVLHAQEILTLENAVGAALEKSYDIKVAQMQQEVVNLQVFKGNAGMLPRVDLNGNIGTAFNEVNQKLSNGSEINRFGRSLAPTTNVAMTWTLYDGKRMYATFDRLKGQGQLSQIQTRQMMENTVVSVMQAYYEVMRQKQTVSFLQTIIKYYEERLAITQQRWEFGKGSKLDYLQSKTELNNQVTQLVQAKNSLRNAKVALNNLMVRSADQDFDVQEVVGIMFDPTTEQLKNQARAANKSLQAIRKTTDISLITQKEVAANKLPRVSLNSSFGYSLSKTNAGLFLYNQNVGLNVGLVASWNIFNGEITRRQIQTSKINTEILRKQEEDTWVQLEGDLMRAYNQYQTDKELLKLEEENNEVAEENLKISLEKFKLGGSTILELNEAQRSLNTSLNRLTNARYNIKISELQVMRLSGELVK